MNCDLRGQYLSIELPTDSEELHFCEVEAITGHCEGKNRYTTLRTAWHAIALMIIIRNNHL